MDPTKWGPGAWDLLHFITFKYPDRPGPKTVQLYRKLFGVLPRVLPYSYQLGPLTNNPPGSLK